VVMVSHPALGSHHQQGSSRVGSARDGNNGVLNNGRATFQSVFHIHLHVVPRQNGDKAVVREGHAAAAWPRPWENRTHFAGCTGEARRYWV